ncbi:MAG: SusD/RagB family nutrient-binding outer membrane lipoprotein, partial [Cytophagaceae bacterium]|nr:SusD/RagB family nutrient-binding outer membrane lipoprotein [Cytophagaceae bacterium]
IHLFFQGTEAWSEWRRTGFPVLKPAAVPLNGGTDIPRRVVAYRNGHFKDIRIEFKIDFEKVSGGHEFYLVPYVNTR